MSQKRRQNQAIRRFYTKQAQNTNKLLSMLVKNSLIPRLYGFLYSVKSIISYPQNSTLMSSQLSIDIFERIIHRSIDLARAKLNSKKDLETSYLILKEAKRPFQGGFPKLFILNQLDLLEMDITGQWKVLLHLQFLSFCNLFSLGFDNKTALWGCPNTLMTSISSSSWQKIFQFLPCHPDR